MSFDYADMAATATELIEEFGAPCVLLKTDNPALYDPASALAENDEPRRRAGMAVRTDYALRDIDGTLIQFGDCKLLISVAGMVAPATGDKVEFAGVTYQVIESKPLSPAGIDLLYEAQARST